MPQTIQIAATATVQLGPRTGQGLGPEEERQLLDSLAINGYVIVCGCDVNDDDDLLDILSVAAEPSAVGNGDGLIHLVTPRQGQARTDISNTFQEFPAHTDSTFLHRPHDVVALACVVPDQEGGESILIDGWTLRKKLLDTEARIARLLEEPLFPFFVDDPQRGVITPKLPIFGGGEQPTIRFRRDSIYSAAAESDGLSSRAEEAIDAFTRALLAEDVQTRFSLEAAQMLIIDNTRMLHGRTAIREGAQRVLKRLKGFRAKPG